MFEELNERLTESSPADVVRPRPRRWFAVLPLASGMLALAAIAPLERLSSPVANDNSSQASPEVVRSNLELLAAVLEDAGQEEDAVFGAFAPALLEISEQVSASGLVDKAVAERLSRILGSMAREAAASTSSTAKALTAAFEAAERGQDVLDEQDRPFRFGSDEAAAGPEGETAVETQQAVSKSPAFDPASVFRTLGEVASSLERNAGDPTAAAGGQQEAADANTGQSSTTGYYTDWDEEMATAQAAKRAAIRQRGRGETVAGEANQSDDSAGDAAGGGTQPLDSGAVETSANTLGSATDEFAIAADIREGGNTSTYLPEPEQGGSDEAGMDTVLRDSLMPGREIPVSIESIVTGDRDVIAAYFGRGSSNGSQGGTR